MEAITLILIIFTVDFSNGNIDKVKLGAAVIDPIDPGDKPGGGAGRFPTLEKVLGKAQFQPAARCYRYNLAKRN